MDRIVNWIIEKIIKIFLKFREKDKGREIMEDVCNIVWKEI